MTNEEHKKLGIDYFNKTWDFIDLEHRTPEQDLEMIHYAHASRLHWQLANGSELNKVRGEWQISRVYCILNMGESALKHAEACYNNTLLHKFGDFDLVFAYECMAFAHRVLGNNVAMESYLQDGYKAIDQVKKKEDKEYCKSELDNIKK